MHLLSLLFAALSAILVGTFPVFAKVRSLRDAKVPSYVFNMWQCIGMAVGSLAISAAANKLAWTSWGLLSGMLFTVSATAAVHSTMCIGVSTASGIWSGTAVVVSFSYGVVVQGEAIANAWQATAGLLLLLTGIGGVAVVGSKAAEREREQQLPCSFSPPLLTSARSQGTPTSIPATDLPEARVHLLAGCCDTDGVTACDGEGTKECDAERWADQGEPCGGEGTSEGCTECPAVGHTGHQRQLEGLAAAVMTGLLGGLVLAPMHQAPPPTRDLAFLPSMAAGALVTSPLVVTTSHLLSTPPTCPPAPLPLHPHTAALPGLASGLTWSLSNLCSVLAIHNLGLAVAYPIMQCGLFVSGLWGIALFGELPGNLRQWYWMPGASVVGGAVVLALSK